MQVLPVSTSRSRTDHDQESFYIRTIDTNNLSDDQSLTRTNSYTKAVSILRQSHDTLSTTLETLHNFLNDTEVYFEKKDSTGEDLWRGFYVLIQCETDHLELWIRRVGQRMQRFEAMKNGLVSYSALEESRRSTRQGSDIGVLTNMTVAYLPFNLAAAIFSLSSTTPSGHIWVYWAVISFMLGLITFYFAFGNRVRHSYTRWNEEHRAKSTSEA
jgi:Mg2+ and Co2+ transporter CorA